MNVEMDSINNKSNLKPNYNFKGAINFYSLDKKNKYNALEKNRIGFFVDLSVIKFA